MISLVQGAPKSLQFQWQTSFGPNLETPPVSDPWDVGLFHGFITSHSLKHVETWNSPRDPGAHRGPTWGPCSKSGGTWRDFLHNYQHSLRGGAMIQMLICQYTCVFYIYIYIIKYYFFFHIMCYPFVIFCHHLSRISRFFQKLMPFRGLFSTCRDGWDQADHGRRLAQGVDGSVATFFGGRRGACRVCGLKHLR